MDWSPLWNEPAPIPAHAVMAIAALGLGAVQLLGPKGTMAHRVIGYAWVVLLSGAALTGLFIHGIRLVGPFSPLHLLIPLTLAGIWAAVRAARRGDIALHKKIMLQLFVLALVVTGAFTLLPGRAMHAVVFGQ